MCCKCKKKVVVKPVDTVETILKIEKVYDIKPPTRSWGECDGYKITTNKQEIFLLISNGQSCCESWGYFMSDDNLDYYIGATLQDIRITDTCRDTVTYGQDVGNYGLDMGATLFVDILTDLGIFQFTAYNAHNGYYGHSAYIVSNQLTNDFCL
jgi:hypothetical protein